jgi:hypothetical protein
MVSSKQSPIVYVQAQPVNRLYPHRQRAGFEYTDIVLLLAGCFAVYGLFLYYFLPVTASTTYQRAALELSYQWQATGQALRYYVVQVLFSQSSLLGDWYPTLVALVMG